MTDELDKVQVKKDLRRWGDKLLKAHVLIEELYRELNEVYQAVEK